MKFELDQTVSILERTPSVLRTMLQDVSPVWTEEGYGDNTWSVHEVLGHLIWGERTDWMPRLHQIVTSDGSAVFEPFDRSGHSQLCRESSTGDLIELFASERAANLVALGKLSLSTEDFAKTGVHPAFGTVTVSEMLSTWTVHDLNHIAQISKAMAYQYRQSVGPWEAYLSILAPPNPR